MSDHSAIRELDNQKPSGLDKGLHSIFKGFENDTVKSVPLCENKTSFGF